eukprot:COSAG01_NODE_3058_length_6654_cov_3.122636_2_plen_89_part_00
MAVLSSGIRGVVRLWSYPPEPIGERAALEGELCGGSEAAASEKETGEGDPLPVPSVAEARAARKAARTLRARASEWRQQRLREQETAQ